MTHPITGAVLLGVGVMMGLAGPFGTVALLSLGPRIVYWLFMAVATYSVGLAVGVFLAPGLAARGFARRVAVTGGITAVGVCAVVLGTNLVVFGWWPGASDWQVFLPTLAAITLIVTALLDYVRTHGSGAVPDAPAPRPAPPAILDRLPLDKRGPLLALSVEDHYVRIRTSKGEGLVLLRLSDAIREVGDVQGAQVHRSHWVAFAAVTSARRQGDRAILTLSDASEVPVSRANVQKIREAGLLPS